MVHARYPGVGLDFSPFSPLVGTGSLFAPNLPWLNPGALALALPVPLPIRHLVSMLVYFTEVSGCASISSLGGRPADFRMRATSRFLTSSDAAAVLRLYPLQPSSLTGFLYGAAS
jgi:hypothetical protein